MHSGKQPTPHSALNDFAVRIIAAGSRNFDDYEFFSQAISAYVARFERETVVFITGKAKTGADALIIRWCEEHGYPWAEFPAKWDDIEAPGAVIRYRRGDGKPYNVKAGYARNTDMAKVATNLIAFWDGRSNGTQHMLGEANRYELTTLMILTDIDSKEDHNEREQTGGASRDSGIRGEAPAW